MDPNIPNKKDVTFFHDETLSTLAYEEINHTWDITNFSMREQSFCSTTFVSESSPQFSWRMELFPFGDDVKKPAVYIDLHCESTLEEHRYNFEASILKCDGCKVFTKVDQMDRRFNRYISCGINLIERDVLFDRANELLRDDKLTIVSKISLTTYHEMESRRKTTWDTRISQVALINDFHSLYDTHMGSDVTLITGDGEVRAHKAILMARSPVFAAMFNADMREKNADRVTITDVPCKVLREVLRFIYTGKGPDQDQINIDLYLAAVKYNLQLLKEVCEESLLSNLSTESAGKLLRLADMHNDQRVKSLVIGFVVRHATKVIQTNGWKSVMKAHPHLLFDVFESMASRHDP